MSILLGVVSAVLLLLAAAAAGWALKSRGDAIRAQVERDAALARLAEREAQFARQTAEREAAAARLEAERKESLARLEAARDAAVKQSVEALKAEFGRLSEKSIKEGAEALDERNRRNLDVFAKRLAEQLKDLQQAADNSRKANERIGTVVGEKLSGIVQTAAALGSKADGLVQALTASNTTVGNWGEAVLDGVLRRSGLVEGVNYFSQQGRDDRPDVQVLDTRGRVLLVDAKANLKSYLEYCNERDPQKANELLRRHVAAVEAQVKRLAERRYVELLRREHPEKTYIDLVAMFVPSEAAFAAAAAEKPSIWQQAYESRVLIVTPQTLLAYLTIVDLAWKQDTALKSQREIVEQAERMLANVNDCLLAVDSLGRALDAAREEYERMRKRLTDGERVQNIVRPARRLKELGVKLESGRGRKESALLSEGA